MKSKNGSTGASAAEAGAQKSEIGDQQSPGSTGASAAEAGVQKSEIGDQQSSTGRKKAKHRFSFVFDILDAHKNVVRTAESRVEADTEAEAMEAAVQKLELADDETWRYTGRFSRADLE